MAMWALLTLRIGDFFIHFLDSPEQGLLVIPLYTDIHPNGGGTWICSEGPKRIGKHLVSPDLCQVLSLALFCESAVCRERCLVLCYVQMKLS